VATDLVISLLGLELEDDNETIRVTTIISVILEWLSELPRIRKLLTPPKEPK